MNKKTFFANVASKALALAAAVMMMSAAFTSCSKDNEKEKEVVIDPELEFERPDISKAVIADKKQPHIVLVRNHTGEGKFTIEAYCKEGSAWIDLNNNGSKESGEELTLEKEVELSTKAPAVTIYGKVYVLIMKNSDFTGIDTSSSLLTQLEATNGLLSALNLSSKIKYLIVHHNLLKSIDISPCKELRRIECQCNVMKEAAILQLIKDLPEAKPGKEWTRKLYLYGGKEEQNTITTRIESVLGNKNWAVIVYNEDIDDVAYFNADKLRHPEDYYGIYINNVEISKKNYQNLSSFPGVQKGKLSYDPRSKTLAFDEGYIESARDELVNYYVKHTFAVAAGKSVTIDLKGFNEVLPSPHPINSLSFYAPNSHITLTRSIPKQRALFSTEEIKVGSLDIKDRAKLYVEKLECMQTLNVEEATLTVNKDLKVWKSIRLFGVKGGKVVFKDGYYTITGKKIVITPEKEEE